MPVKRKGNTLAGKVPEGMLSTSQFAKRVGVSVDTIKRWREIGVLRAAKRKKAGKLNLHLYSEEQVEQGRALRRGGHGPLAERL